MLKANINIWMLTGDKLETATNIGFSCNLLNPETKIHQLSSFTDGETLRNINTSIQSETIKKHALIVEGEAIAKILKNEVFVKYFLTIVYQC